MCLVKPHGRAYISNMMFGNDLAEDPTTTSQIVRHLPIALAAFGLLAAFVALHVAATGIAIAAVAHIAIGAAVFAIRRHRGAGNQPTEAGPTVR